MKSHTSLAVTVACLATAGIGLSSPAGAQARPTPTQDITVYVDDAAAPKAATADSRAGQGSFQASTVAEAQRIAEASRARNVTIRLAPGVYPPIDWSYGGRGGRITVEGAGAASIRTSADGSAASGAADASAPAATVVRCSRAASEYGVRVRAGDANATVSGMTIEKCRHGGVYVKGASSVKVRGNVIRYIGSKHVSQGDPKKEGFGGVHLQGASRATISDNRFFYLENNGRSPAGMHGVYAANNADRTIVENNRFGYISGDPVRFRHGSDNARVTSNRFWRTGFAAIVSDWRFGGGSEKCGKGTVLKNNIAGNRTYTNKKYYPDASRNTVKATMRKWGKGDFEARNIGGCNPAPITFAGGNKWTGSRPW
ncbi:right-handed parallel beta-helix repeat-containing protein [Streptomyces alfalfae]|uniref:Right-handed parallel beta-helix repeat-containing protein n=1 Tax=Streptomyces alfalfae TaxID=1642299 RepID=A0A7T4PN21_9ACTN|nr:right-handed parallel beta-helix repeat-containing protein [Streptomyces alfalfae]QQC93307.1 right-handed parallel beta-helix repeat-containing protein [Streptomyces alfalfae]